MDGDDGSTSGDVSSKATDEVVPPAYPELPQPNAWPPMGPTENDAAFLEQFARRYSHLGLSRLRLGGPNTGHSAIFFDTPDDGGGGDPRIGDVDAADANANGGGDGGDNDNDEDGGGDDGYDGLGFSFGGVPASGVAIACLPETSAGEARESGQCAVCQEEYEAGDALRTMPCAHGFHERCIFEWLRASRLCPLCRFALPAEEEEGTEPDVEVGRDDRGEADDDDGLMINGVGHAGPLVHPPPYFN